MKTFSAIQALSASPSCTSSPRRPFEVVLQHNEAVTQEGVRKKGGLPQERGNRQALDRSRTWRAHQSTEAQGTRGSKMMESRGIGNGGVDYIMDLTT